MNVAWDALVAGQTKDFDLALSEISITDERKKVVDFSVPYFSSDIGVLVKKGTKVDATSIKGMRIGAQQATTGAAFVDEKLKPTTPASVYPDQGSMFTALQAGQIDVAMTDTAIILAQAGASNGQHGSGRAIRHRRDLRRSLSRGIEERADDRQDHPGADRRRHAEDAVGQVPGACLGRRSDVGAVLQAGDVSSAARP